MNNPLYPYNMIEDVLELEKTHKYIVIPSDNLVVNILQKNMVEALYCVIRMRI